MFLFFFLFFCVPVFFAADLTYHYKEGDKFAYKVKNLYESRLVTVENVFDLVEELKTTSMHEFVRKQEDGIFHLLNHIVLEERKHNGEKVEIEEHLKDLYNYEYLVDPLMGKTKILGDSSFLNDDLMEFIVAFPGKDLNEKDTWEAKYSWNMPLGQKSRFLIPGKYKVIKIQGDLVTIQGRFKSRIEKSEDLSYEGVVQLQNQLVFHLGKGRFESGKHELKFVYESRSNFARFFYQKSGKKEKLGYQIHFVSEFEETEPR